MVSFKLILSAIAALATSAVCNPVPDVKGPHPEPSPADAALWMDQHRMDNMITFCDSDYDSKHAHTDFHIRGYVSKLDANFEAALVDAVNKCRDVTKVEWSAFIPLVGNADYFSFSADWHQSALGDKCTTHALRDNFGIYPGTKCS